jgi:hypothetical protein
MAFIVVSGSRAARKHPSSRALAVRLRIFAVVVLLAYVGASLLISAGLHTRSLGLPIAGGLKTQGVVVNERVTDEKSYVYRPIVVFLDAEGQRIEIEGAPRSSPAGLGRRVPISYDPSDPSDAHDLATSSTWLFQFGAGLVFLLTALGCTRLLWWVWRHGPISAQVPPEPARPFG